jgi:hypothetical protein
VAVFSMCSDIGAIIGVGRRLQPILCRIRRFGVGAAAMLIAAGSWRMPRGQAAPSGRKGICDRVPTELVSPDGLALQPVQERSRREAFLRAELAASRNYLPPGEHVLRAFSRPLSQVKVSSWDKILTPPGHPVGLSFSVASHVRPIHSLQNIYASSTDLASLRASGDLTLVPARCPVAQSSADGSAWSLGIPPRQRLGAGDTAGDRRSGRSGWPAGGDLVGARRAVTHTYARLSPLPGERPPVTVVRGSWVLRVTTFQPCQRPTGAGGRRAGRLGARASKMRELCPDRRSDPRRPRCPR